MLRAMLSLLLAAVVATSPPPLPSTELPGLSSLHWGMSSAEVAKSLESFSWLIGPDANGTGMTGGRAQVAGVPATVMCQFGKDHLAVIMVAFDKGEPKGLEAQFEAVSRVLRAKLGSPKKAKRGKPAPRTGTQDNSPPRRFEQWKVRGSEVTHGLGKVHGDPFHSLHASDRRRPDYGQPTPDYEATGYDEATGG